MKTKSYRKTKQGKEFEKLLPLLGYKSTHTINKAFQNKLNPTVKEAFRWEKEFGIPAESWVDIKEYLKNKHLEEEGDTSSTEKVSA